MSTSRPCRAARSSTRACSRPGSSSRSSPTCPTGATSPSSRWSTPGSPPTRSRRWPLAHPYRLIAHNGEINTVKGNRNWMAARESQLVSDVIPGDLDRLLPICTPGASDSASFDEVLELLHLGGRPLPHAVLMMIPEAWENHAEMDPARRAFYEFHAVADGAVGRPGLHHLHRRQPDRRGARPQRPAAQPLLGDRGRPGRARQRGRRARPRPGDRRAQGPAPAGPDVPRRHRPRPHRRRRRDQGRARGRRALRRVAARRADPPQRPARARARRAHPRQRHPAPADLRLHRGGAAGPAHADGPRRRRADRVDGHRHTGGRAVRAAAAALRLLHPAVRAGHQPAAGRDPRGARHLARHRDRAGPEPAHRDAGALPPGRPRLPRHRQRRARQDPAHQPRRRPARLRRDPDPRALPGRGRRRRAA